MCFFVMFYNWLFVYVDFILEFRKYNMIILIIFGKVVIRLKDGIYGFFLERVVRKVEN